MSFSALTLLVGQKEGNPACKTTKWLGTGMIICLERGADLHTACLMILPLTVSCSSKIQIGFTFLVPAHLCSLGQRAIKRVLVCFVINTRYSLIVLKTLLNAERPTCERVVMVSAGLTAVWLTVVTFGTDCTAGRV